MAGGSSARARLKRSHGLSARVRALRELFFEGTARRWNNEWTCWSTGTAWDLVYDETSFHIVPETYAFFPVFVASARQAARDVPLPRDFWRRSLPERRAWFIKKVMVDLLPHEVLPGDLLCGARFNILASRCLDRRQARARDREMLGPRGARAAVKAFHDHGYGNAGATSGHLIPDYARVLREGFAAIHGELHGRLAAMSAAEREGPRGRQLEAMALSTTMARDLAARYAGVCRELAGREADATRRGELEQMAANLDRVPWRPARTFWEAVQSLWLTHMLVMADENYPGPGVSFGRLDQILLPYWERSAGEGMTRAWAKEILGCFWVHANTAYDAMVRMGGNQGITAGFGQLFNLSGLGPGGRDMTNELTWVLLEVIDEMSPILEPKPNVRLHRGSPEALLDRVVEMIAASQGAPFLLNFDERAMAGLLREARRAGLGRLIHEGNVHDYASVGCLENTMVGNDRSGTVDVNLNLLKAVELALTGGDDLVAPLDPIFGGELPIAREGPRTGDARGFESWGQLWEAWRRQTAFIVDKAVALYERTESIRARFAPTPYLSCLVRGCADKGLDVTQGGAEISLVTIEGVTFATTVDSLLAIKYLVFDEGRCTMDELLRALRANWEGHDKLQAFARFRAPKYGRDDPEADAMARAVMEVWTEEVWRHRTASTGRRFRPGMLSWNYWVGDGFVMAASADGRPRGRFLSNAICPSNGADTRGPTANANSVGTALGGMSAPGEGDWGQTNNLLPNGASHTISFSPALLADREHREKFKAFLRGYAHNGGTALQVNVIDAEMLREAQRHPEEHRHLLVRVTGYNAYFTAIGRELQDELIARLSHAEL